MPAPENVLEECPTCHSQLIFRWDSHRVLYNDELYGIDLYFCRSCKTGWSEGEMPPGEEGKPRWIVTLDDDVKTHLIQEHGFKESDFKRRYSHE